jgi:hypothetical protein
MSRDLIAALLISVVPLVAITVFVLTGGLELLGAWAGRVR